MQRSNRTNQRHPTTFVATITSREGSQKDGVARNISTEGMMLELDSRQLSIGEQIEVSFSFHGQQWSIAAQVMHANTTGMGIRFSAAQPQLVRA
ncbi:serine/threonine protein phosphatase, partial [Candidatus Endoriftia persephone str. Guaymas]|nr:serine/threonine protein phosphatase [Candidatus Endoriftia persephone str. Guaymas]